MGLYLSKTFLAGPHRRVDDLEEELASPGVEDEDGSIDGLCGQVTLKGLKRTHEDYMKTDTLAALHSVWDGLSLKKPPNSSLAPTFKKPLKWVVADGTCSPCGW